MISTAVTKPLLVSDAALPQRDLLLSECSMASRLSGRIRGFRQGGIDECRIERVKYRFGKSIRVLYKVRLGNETVRVAARTFDPSRLTEIRAAKRASEVGSTKALPDFFDDDLQAAFWVFPNDRKISDLSVLTNIPNDLRQVSGRIWNRSHITAYAPEKSITAQCLDESGGTIAYAKVFAGDEGRRIHNIYKTFSRAKVCLPRVLAYSDLRRTLILEAVQGARVADLRLEGRSAVYREFGAAVARFHQTEPGRGLRPFKRLDVEELCLALQTIARALPHHAFQAARIVKTLSAFSHDAGPDVCLHGDLHAKNAIWNNGQLTLIDLDQVSVGDAAMDIGSFLGSLHYKKCTGQLPALNRAASSREFLNGYASVCQLPPESSLRRYAAVALFAERALRAVTRYRAEGLENMGQIFTTAESILSGGEL